MKIIGIAASPRKGKTSFFALDECLKSLKEKLDQARKDLYSIQEKQNAA